MNLGHRGPTVHVVQTLVQTYFLEVLLVQTGSKADFVRDQKVVQEKIPMVRDLAKRLLYQNLTSVDCEASFSVLKLSKNKLQYQMSDEMHEVRVSVQWNGRDRKRRPFTGNVPRNRQTSDGAMPCRGHGC